MNLESFFGYVTLTGQKCSQTLAIIERTETVISLLPWDQIEQITIEIHW